MLVFFILFVCFVPSGASDAPLLRVHFINVGYADAILVQFPDHSAALIDAGEAASATDIEDYLKSAGIKHVPIAVITHPHQNHFGGFISLIEEFRFGEFFINGGDHAEPGYTGLLALLKEKRIPIRTVKKGKNIQLPGGLQLKVLHPDKLVHGVNGNALVTALTYEKVILLFTADIEEEQQKQLVKDNPWLKSARVVQVPHHGGPVSDPFARFFTDTVFVVSTGENKWGLPKDEDLLKLKGIVFRTDIQGAIIVETDGRDIKVISAR